MRLKILLVIITNAVIVASDCGADICVSDYIKGFFNNEDTAVVKSENRTIIEEQIEIVDLDTILKQISNLLTKQNNTGQTLVKNFKNKTYVVVKTIDIDEKDKIKNSTDSDLKIQPTENNDKSTLTYLESSNNEGVSNKNFYDILKKAVEKDNEIFIDDAESLYNDFNDDNSTDYLDIDYIEIYKDTPVEEYLYIPTESTIYDDKLIINNSSENKNVDVFAEYSLDWVEVPIIEPDLNKADFIEFVPWITTIFLMNRTNNFQYDYLCDGVLISKNTILTGARCVIRNNATVDPNDLLIILGKKSLTATGNSEKISKIQQVIPHENFTNEDTPTNDLAILVIEEPVVVNNGIKIANISDLEDFDVESDEAATTAWSVSGEITPIYFDKYENDMCGYLYKAENTICATYGNDVPLCPSYGGPYLVKIEDEWYLQGLFYGDPKERGICFSKSVIYTSLRNYLDWILDLINSHE